MSEISSLNVTKFLGSKVELSGFIHTRRDHGKIFFIDLRDREGLIQLVFHPQNKKSYQIAQKLSAEDVIEISGKVNKRPKGMENEEIKSGTVEVEVEEIKILSEAKTLPINITTSREKISEEKRLKYRYLDLRSNRMKENLRFRSQANKVVRDFLLDGGFWEIETPLLTKGTPEGAREFIVPSRNQPGKFYVLPQSPQQFKQLLMVAGVEKYFQIAKVFRDEDPRGDRQFEFTQIDIEESFVKKEEIMKLTEELMLELVKKLLPDKKISKSPFPILTWKEAQKKYQTDKPDLRKNKNDQKTLAYLWIVDFPLFEHSQTEKKLVSVHHPFTQPVDTDLKLLSKSPSLAHAKHYELVLNGYEVAAGSIRITDPKLQKQIFKILGLSDSEISQNFGHILEAFQYGVPPHGGIAIGWDRLLMVLKNESSIREMIAFPKTGDGRDLMMGAPSEVSKQQLRQLKIKTT